MVDMSIDHENDAIYNATRLRLFFDNFPTENKANYAYNFVELF